MSIFTSVVMKWNPATRIQCSATTPGRTRCGKIPWDKLADAKAKELARETTGLGLSQTAEVAYLDRLGLRCNEHDVTSLDAFLLF